MEAKWIWPENMAGENQYARFGDSFIISGEEPVLAEISVSGEYALYLNGTLAAFGQYSDWPEDKTVRTVDITEMCRAGENRFTLECWHPNLDTLVSVVCQARVFFRVRQDSRTVLASGEGTPCCPMNRYEMGPMPLITSQLGHTFRYDATAEEAPLGRACIVPEPKKTHGQMIAPMRMGGFKRGERIAQGVFVDLAKDEPMARRMRKAALSARFEKEMADGDGFLIGEKGLGLYAVFDMGKESVGFLRLRVTAKEKTTLLIGWGEHLADLRVRTEIGARGFTAMVTVPAGESTFTHYFRRLGCRYIQILALTDEIRFDDVGLLPVDYPFKEKEDYKPDSPLHRKIYQVGLDTLRLCVHTHYEDCPWREQALYAMDSRVDMLCGYYAFGEKTLPLAGLTLLAGGLREDGIMELCAPAKLDRTIPSFTLAWVVNLWEYALYTGDIDGMASLLPTALTVLNKMADHTDSSGRVCRYPDGPYWNFYEWQKGLDGEDKTVTAGRPEGLLTSWYVLALQAAEKCCEAAGRSEGIFLRMQAEQAALALESFWSEERQSYGAAIENGKPVIFSSLMQSLVLLTGTAREERARALRQKLRNQDDLIPVTLNDALLRYQALLKDEKNTSFVFDEVAKVWGDMLYVGATSFWETADGEKAFHQAGSLCHGWSAVPVWLYHAHGRGLRPDSPGHFKQYPPYKV